MTMKVTMVTAAWVAMLLQAGADDLAVSDELRASFALDDHYQQAVVVEGFPIVASARVSSAAMREAEWVVRGMLGKRPDLLRALAKSGARFSIMAVDERTVDIPEHADLEPALWWNRRARGLGATKPRPAVSCGEENLLCCPGDPYATESIAVHEFAHAVQDMGMTVADPTFDERVKKAFRWAMAEGKWKGTYAATNFREYFAEGAQSWFGTNRPPDQIHNHVDTREELIEYDPGLAKLCAEVFGEDNPWVYVRPDDPSRVGKGHLKGFERSELPAFAWTEEEQAAGGKSRKEMMGEGKPE